MKKTKLNNRFFETSRGRIVMLLRRGAKTVNDLAQSLALTDNAVRAHLLSLERDGLVEQSGIQRGTRKPHFAYQLTDEAENLFPKAYDTLLNEFISALQRRLSAKALEDVLREVGRSLAASQPAAGRGVKGGLERGLVALESLGGAARIEKDSKHKYITSDSCPLSEAVAEHPEVCKLAETLLTEIIGSDVRQECVHDPKPRCRFQVIR